MLGHLYRRRCPPDIFFGEKKYMTTTNGLLLPLPLGFPSEAVRLVIAKLRGSDVPMPTALHACWEVLGWGLSLLHVAGDGRAANPGPSDDDLANALQAHTTTAGMVAGAVPWAVLIPLLLRLAERWLAKE